MGTWAVPILVILFTLVWCLGIYGLIPNRAGDWQYGVFPYIPAQSFFTTRELHRQAPPSQVEYPSTVRRLAHGR
ncbi:MAG TPA: hypothetical protein VHR86_10045 [Armatimonadota bacterium]|nr:hypothetical protein [Armatimonadota bacterium]